MLKLDLDEPPIWRPWAAVFAFVVDLLDWQRGIQGQSTYMISSSARDLVEKHRPHLEPHFRLANPQSDIGESYSELFAANLADMCKWMKSVV